MSPPSQKFRRIGFYLSGGSGPPSQCYLNIRPETLSRTEPSRLNVQQTLGGAWADSFNIGLSTINMAGHCGWRGSFLLSGEDMFQALRIACFQGWHDRRKQAITAGKDPSAVTLTLTDDLDNIDQIVAPVSFTLNRSRTSPLLMRYQIQLAVLGDANTPKSLFDSIIAALNNPLRWLAGVTGLGNVLTQMQAFYSDGVNGFGAATAAVQSFLGTGIGLLTSIQSTAQQLQGDFSGAAAALLSVGQEFSVAAANALSALSLDDTLSSSDLIPAVRLPALFNDANCILSNCFTSDRSFVNYDALLGASSCSSTGGGDPASPYTLAGTNPFADLFSSNSTVLVAVSADASLALTALLGDPLDMVGQDAAIIHALQLIASGVTVPTS